MLVSNHLKHCNFVDVLTILDIGGTNLHRVLSYQLLWPLTRLLLDQRGSRSQREVDPPRIQMDHQRNEAAQGKNARQGTAEDPFAEQSAVAPIAVPPEPVQEVGDGIGEEPAPQDQQVIEVPPNQPPPPTRATFAGRTRVGSESFQKQWDDRRAKYYQMVPPELWKDGLERDFWALCSQCESLDDAVVKFLEKNPANKPLDQPPNHRLAAAQPRFVRQSSPKQQQR